MTLRNFFSIPKTPGIASTGRLLSPRTEPNKTMGTGFYNKSPAIRYEKMRLQAGNEQAPNFSRIDFFESKLRGQTINNTYI